MNSLGFDDRKISLIAQVFYAQKKNRLEQKAQTCQKKCLTERRGATF